MKLITQPQDGLAPMLKAVRKAKKTVDIVFANERELHSLYQTGDFDKAIQQFLAVLDIEPDGDAGYSSLDTLLPMAAASWQSLRVRSWVLRDPETRAQSLAHHPVRYDMLTDPQGRATAILWSVRVAHWRLADGRSRSQSCGLGRLWQPRLSLDSSRYK